jgi:hypothetical protein
VRLCLYALFDKYLDPEEEARQILAPTATDRLIRQVRGALKNAITAQGGKITNNEVEAAAKQMASQLEKGGSDP